MGILTFSENIADATAPDPLPPGEYECTCVAASETVSKSSGNPRLALTLKVARSAYPVDFDPGFDDVTLNVNNLTTRDIPGDRYRLKKYCTAFGVPMSRSVDPDDFVGRQARVITKVEPDLEGNPRPAIVSVQPL